MTIRMVIVYGPGGGMQVVQERWAAHNRAVAVERVGSVADGREVEQHGAGT